MIKPIVCILLMFSIFSCFRKKTPPDNIRDWLENAFPGKFEVLDSNLKMMDVMAQLKGKKEALVADKADKAVQFLLDWTKGVDNLGLNPAIIQAAYEKSSQEARQSRQLFKDLKNKGLEQFSVGVIEQAAYIQVYLEPIPEVRARVLGVLTEHLGQQENPSQTSIFVAFLEPETFHTEIQDIIPRGHWKVDAGFLRENQIMTLDFEYKKGLDFSKVTPFWELNPESKRAVVIQKQCFEEAKFWASSHLPKPCFMSAEALSSFESLEAKAPTICYSFPYFSHKPTEKPGADQPEPAGYVAGNYDFDQKTFSSLHKQKRI